MRWQHPIAQGGHHRGSRRLLPLTPEIGRPVSSTVDSSGLWEDRRDRPASDCPAVSSLSATWETFFVEVCPHSLKGYFSVAADVFCSES
jgi:hypothetical protein